MDDGRELGFAGLVAAGMTPVDAWAKIRAETTPAALAVIRDLESDEDGRAALAWLRGRWAAYGLRPPWEGLELPGEGTPGAET